MSLVYPFVSVIVPVRNERRNISRCIEALLAQEYPENRYEILVIDNGSRDGTQSVIRSYPVVYLEAPDAASPYAARNVGLAHARGEIYAFTDARCAAHDCWLREGVRALRKHKADLAGGKVRFVFSADRTAAELFDSVTNVRMEDSIKRRQVAKGCNLFIKRNVFGEIGPWPEQRSGGDIAHTKAAVKAGYRLIYAARAEVRYPARKFRELLMKSRRVGRGKASMYLAENGSQRWKWYARTVVGLCLPPPIGPLRARLREGIEEGEFKYSMWRFFLIAWCYRGVGAVGRLEGAMKHKGQNA